MLDLPLAPAWAGLLRLPRPHLHAGVVLFASVIVFSMNGSTVDLPILCVVGTVGFAVPRLGRPVALALVLLAPLIAEVARRDRALPGDEAEQRHDASLLAHP